MIRSKRSKDIRHSYLRKVPFCGQNRILGEKIPPLHIFFFSFWVRTQKRRERSVKHKQHKTDGKSHGKWTILGGNFREKHHFKNSRFPVPKREISKLRWVFRISLTTPRSLCVVFTAHCTSCGVGWEMSSWLDGQLSSSSLARIITITFWYSWPLTIPLNAWLRLVFYVDMRKPNVALALDVQGWNWRCSYWSIIRLWWYSCPAETV